MKSLILNRTSSQVDATFVRRWVRSVANELQSRKVANDLKSKSLQIIFINRAQSQQLNHQFRKKKKPTDVLSFSPAEPGSLGELAICVPLVRVQAKEHQLTFNEELGYLLLHGILHLLGFEHEKGRAQARRMFKLQDELFEDLCAQLRTVKTK